MKSILLYFINKLNFAIKMGLRGAKIKYNRLFCDFLFVFLKLRLIKSFVYYSTNGTSYFKNIFISENNKIFARKIVSDNSLKNFIFIIFDFNEFKENRIVSLKPFFKMRKNYVSKLSQVLKKRLVLNNDIYILSTNKGIVSFPPIECYGGYILFCVKKNDR